MTAIKILPKNIFSVDNYNFTNANKISGTSGSLITTSTNTLNLGNASWESFGGDISLSYEAESEWRTAYKEMLAGTPNRYWQWQAIKYKVEARFSQRETAIDANEYIDYKTLGCKVDISLNLPEDSSQSNGQTIPKISRTNWGNYNYKLPTIIKPSSFGTLVYDTERSGSNIYATITSGSPDSGDVKSILNTNWYYITSPNNISYAINSDTQTSISFDTKLSFPNRIDAYYVIAMQDTKENAYPPSDPASWTYQSNFDFLISNSSISLSKITGSFTSSSIENITENVNYNNNPYYKFDENSFFRTDMIKGSKSLFYATSDDMISKWSNGRKSVKLKCSIGEYNDTEGNLALSTQHKSLSVNNRLSMFFKIGDIVEPYIVDGQGKTVPLSKKPNGNATQFEVLSVKLYTDGACWQDIELLEIT